MEKNYLHSDLTSEIIRSFFIVYNELGYGFLEKVYETAMITELTSQGLYCLRQQPVEVYYKRQKVGFYIADIIVEGKVIVEIKAAETIAEAHEAQLTNYLKATHIEVGLLLNFGKKATFKRKAYTRAYKNHDPSSQS